MALQPVELELGRGPLADLRARASGVRLLGEASAKITDAVLSFGERLSARVVAAALTAKGIEATAVDAFAAGMVTDSSFGRARPVPDDGRMLRYLDEVTGVPVVTGFLGADQDGNITTLGRNGSDYSASFFVVATAATEIHTLTLHAALPIARRAARIGRGRRPRVSRPGVQEFARRDARNDRCNPTLAAQLPPLDRQLARSACTRASSAQKMAARGTGTS